MTQASPADTQFGHLTPSRWLDMRGETCPTPTDETFRVLEEMAIDEVVEVESDYYPAKSTIPYLCDKRGYQYALSDDEQTTWRIRIQKG